MRSTTRTVSFKIWTTTPRIIMTFDWIALGFGQRGAHGQCGESERESENG